MSVCRKLPDGTVQKIAGHTILLDANVVRVATEFDMSAIIRAGACFIVEYTKTTDD